MLTDFVQLVALMGAAAIIIPWVFFAAGGIAFHEGRQDTNSAGCVKLVREDAQEFFEYLQVGDQVQIR